MRDRRRGSALVITLIFVILLSSVLVAYVTTASIERRSVQSHYSKVQADLLSRMAAEAAASRLAGAAGQTNSWWVSQPGRVAWTPFSSNSSEPVTTFVDLTSGSASSVVEDVSVNLNPPALTEPQGLVVSSTAAVLPVQWVYVRQDGTQIANPASPPAYSGSASPIIGRYAFWTDDESGRVNVNAALSSTNAQAEITSHPSRVDLAMLAAAGTSGTFSAADVSKLAQARTQRLFGSVEDLKSAAGTTTVADAVKAQKGALAHYNQTPDLNPFGDEKIVLTTQKSLAGGRPFLDILTTDNTDPGDVDNISKAKIEALFAKLYPYFTKQAREWGLTGVNFNQTYVTKYTAQGVSQIILNLLDYVRSVESSQVLVLPIRGSFNAATAKFTYRDDTGGAASSYGTQGLLGNSRRLHIVEMAYWLPDAPVSSVVSGATVHDYEGKLKVRVYLPATAGGSVDLAATGANATNILYTIYPKTPDATTGEKFSVVSGNFNITTANLTESSVIAPGQYRTIFANVKMRVPSATFRPKDASIRTALRRNTGGSFLSYDLAPVWMSAAAAKDAAYDFDPPGTPEATMTSIATDDPVINQCAVDWNKQGPNTFGTQNLSAASKLGQPAATSGLPQDADGSGNLTNVSTRPPPPKGAAGNLLGRVGSVGDLGFVHSGGRGTSLFGASWRTLRFQPRRAASATLPDWPLFELFAPPVVPRDAADEAVLRPSAKTAGGRLNLNATLFPFTASQWSRTGPLVALLRGANPALAAADAATLADNLLGHTLAIVPFAGVAFGPTDFKDSKLYLMPGEIAEIKGIADTGEASEPFASKLVGLLSVRSNVFGVYAVGQKIIQLPSGKIKVLGESRTRTVLERQENGKVRILSTQELGL